MTASTSSFVFHLVLILTGGGADANKFARQNLRFDSGSNAETDFFEEQFKGLIASKGVLKDDLTSHQAKNILPEPAVQRIQMHKGNAGQDTAHHLIQRDLHEVSTPFTGSQPPYNPMEVFDPGCEITECGVCEPVVTYSPAVDSYVDVISKRWKAEAWPSDGIVKFYEWDEDVGDYIFRKELDEGAGDCFGREVSISYKPYNILIGAPGYSDSPLNNIGKVTYHDLALDKSNNGHLKDINHHDLMELPFMEGEQDGSSFGTNIGLSSNSHAVAISEPGYNNGEGRITLFAYLGHWHEAAVFTGDISNGVTGYNMFGTYGLDVNLDISEITVSAERYGGVHFHRNETLCMEHCIDPHASCQNITSGTLPFLDHVHGDQNLFDHQQHHHDHNNFPKYSLVDVDWYQCVCDEGYSSHALLIGDEVANFCLPPSLYNIPATIYDATHYVNCTTYRDTCPSYAETCDASPGGVGCQGGFTCDNDTLTCRIPELGESCSTEAGKNCLNGNVCDTGSNTCRKPDETELCLSDVGCLDGYVCGDDGVCRLPIVTEPCIESVPCNGTLFCNETTGQCQAPVFKEECDPFLWGCHRDLVCGGDYTCRLPIDLESCEYDKICYETYMCDNVTGDWECRMPVEFEPCVQSIGCLGLFQCDGVSGVCRKPILSEACDEDMGCNTTHLCDTPSGTCRLPVEGETCDFIVGCEGTLQCGEDNVCRKPIVGEACELGPGPGCLGGIVCAIEEKLCRLPFPDEPCNHAASEFPKCSPTLVCGANDTCILPTLNETCDTEFNCEPKFRCSEEKVCRNPIENELCDENVPCEFPFVCNNETGRCRKPRDGEECEEIHGCDSTHKCDDGNPRKCRLPGPGEYCTEFEGCFHESMTCDLSVCVLPDVEQTCDANIGCRSRLVCDSEKCRLPIVNEMCDSLKENCAEGLWCINSNCTLPDEAYETCSPDFGCDNFYVCDQTDRICREPIDGEPCDQTCTFGFTCDSGTCRLPRVENSIGEECNRVIGCEDGYSCSVGPASICRQPWLGESCNENIGCGNGLACSAINKCIGFVYTGDACGHNRECFGDLICKSGECAAATPNRVLYNNNEEKEQNHRRATSLGYGSTIMSYGTDQDGGGGVEVISKDNTVGVKMFGNAWKAFPLDNPLFVNRNSVLKFKFARTQDAEGHAICIDENADPDTFVGYERRCIAVAGLQVEGGPGVDVLWDDVLIPTDDQKNDVTNGGESYTQYEVPIGRLFQYQNTQVEYIAFIQDYDALPTPQGINLYSVFWDVRVETGSPSSGGVQLFGVFDKQDLFWSEVPVPSDIDVTEFYRPSSRILLTKTSRVTTTKNTGDKTSFDHGFHYRGIDNIIYSHDQKQALYFMDVKYRDGFSEDNGKDSVSKTRTFQLNPGENITYAKFTLEKDKSIGPEYVTWETDDNNMLEMRGDGKKCDPANICCCNGHKEEEYRAPAGYILGGIRGWLNGDDEIASVGFNWVKKELEPEGASCGRDDRCVHIAYSQNGRFMVLSDPNGQKSTSNEQDLDDGDGIGIDIHFPRITVLEDIEGDGNFTLKSTALLDFAGLLCNIPGSVFTCATYQYDGQKETWKYENGSAVDISNDGTVYTSYTSPDTERFVRVSPDGAVTADIEDGVVTLGNSQTFKGEQVDFSPDSKRIITAYDDEDGFTTACVYEKNTTGLFSLVGKECYKASQGGLASLGVAVNSADEPHPTFYLRESTTSVRAYQIVPIDCPCQLENSGCRYDAFDWKCICAGGFVNADTGVQRIDDAFDLCIPSILLDKSSGGEDNIGISMKVENDGVFNINEQSVSDFTELIRLRKPGVDDNDVEVSLKKDQIGFTNNTNYMYITVNGLNPGMAYNLTLVDADGDWLSPDPTISATTKCSCSPGSEVTGRPSGLSTYQELGFVRFSFTDNSLCESGFAVTRSDTTEEFVVDVSKYGASFAPDYYFTASAACGAEISPGSNLQDDLQKSNLLVGHNYMYCVRAFADNYYMMDTSGLSSNTKATSSGEACTRHQILWEAALNGRITTTKSTGTLPINDVRVTWRMYKQKGTQELASGVVSTDEGGRFQIVIRSGHESLTNTNENFVLLSFYKETPITNGTITHQFLCNDGQDDCSDSGAEVYLKHLNFEEQVQIYDNTSIPFRGIVNVAGSRCGVSGVEVCIVDSHGKGAPYGTVVSVATENTEDTELTKYCAETDSNGEYVITPVIGTIISYATLNHYNHSFSVRGRDSNFWELPMTISSDTIYDRMNFEDTSTGTLLVDIFGGKCNIPLGKAEIVMSIKGCDNSLWERRRFQLSPRQSYSVPAQEIELYVNNLYDTRTPDERPLEFIMSNYFYPGDTPLILTKDMREILTEDAQLQTAEGLEQSSLSDLQGEGNDSEVTEEEQTESAALTEEISEKLHIIRFQYNGVLTMTTEIVSPQTSMDVDNCGSVIDESWLESRKINSFHVMNSADLVSFMVRLDFEILPAYDDLGIEARNCDIVGESTKVMVLSQIGIDDNEGFDAWFERQPEQIQTLLQLCSTPPCLFPVQHDTDLDSGALLGNAHVGFTLVTGRPKIAGDHIKTVLIQVLGDDSNKHTAGIFVEGLYDKGPGDSFAVPTHEPLMILRDPPGGLSYASYENMKTTIRAKGESQDVVANIDLAAAVKTKIEQHVDSCVGLGVALCKNILDVAGERDIVNVGVALDYTYEESEEYSHTYTTTWSYQTSDDPYTAGPMSDVFVVPNFNVMFQEVTNVFWNNDVCDGETVDRLSFSLDNPRNAPAITFYTRWHVQYEKLPDLQDSRDYFIGRKDVISASLQGSNDLSDCTCCEDNDQNCIETFDCVCDESHLQKADEKAEFLSQGIVGWEEALRISEEALTDENKESIVDWFKVNKYDRPFEGDMQDHPLASLSPTDLLEEAKCLGCIDLEGTVKVDPNMCPPQEEETFPEDNIDVAFVKNEIKKEYDESNSGDEVEITRFVVREAKCVAFPGDTVEYTAVILPVSMVRGEPDLMNTKRIQFSGGGGLYELHFDKEYSDGAELSHGFVLGASLGFRRHLTNEAAEPSETIIDVKGGGAGVEVDFSHAYSIEHSHQWIDGGEDYGGGTSVAIVLGDADVGDEFVVDMFVDKRYGTVMFETIGGKSKCPREYGTLAIEDPSLEFATFPPQNVMYNEDIVFQLKLANVGVGASAFRVFTNHALNTGDLAIDFNGGPLIDAIQYDKLESNQEVIATFTISRGPLLYKYNPIDFQLFSACENDANLGDGNMRDPNAYAAFTSIDLWNVMDENTGERYLQFLQPCPRVEWAGSIRREHGFLVNTKSTVQDKVLVTVHNPKFSERTFAQNLATTPNCTDCRLEDVKMYYRELGTIQWRTALTDTGVNLDFANPNVADETPYGYLSLHWGVGGLKEAHYELMVTSQCDDPGTPDDFNSVSTNVLMGVIDKTPPRQFGSALPLSEYILVGEPIVIMFTEPIHCERPYTFDLNVIVDGVEQTFSRDFNLLIVCEGRRLEFTIDPTFVDATQLLGKTFTVEVGTNYDLPVGVRGELTDENDNMLKPNILFSKQFANLDLSETTATFTLTIGAECSQSTTDAMMTIVESRLSNELNYAVDPGRISISSASCINGDSIVATASITPPAQNLRRGLSMTNPEQDSLLAFYTLQDSTRTQKDDKNSPLISFSGLKIKPGQNDERRLGKKDKVSSAEGEETYPFAYQEQELNSPLGSDFMAISHLSNGGWHKKGLEESTHKSTAEKEEILNVVKDSTQSIEDLKQMLIAEHKEVTQLRYTVACIGIFVAIRAFVINR